MHLKLLIEKLFCQPRRADYTHKKQSGGAGQFARVKLQLEPLDPGKGREVENKIKGGAIPKEFIPGVEKGIESVSDNGILAGFPIIDYKVTILDGLHHDVDSSVLAFELASRQCFKDACQKATLKTFRTNNESRSSNTRRLYG